MLGFRKTSDTTQVIETPTLEDVPPRCVTLDDYFAHPARLASQRILKALTNLGETPAFEYIHNFRLVPALSAPQTRDAAIRVIALAQAKTYQEDAAALTQVLINRVSEIQRLSGRSYELDRFYKAYLDGDSGALLKAVDQDPATGINRVLSYVAARIVREKSNWREKISTLVHQIEDAADQRFSRAIDAFVAELLDTPILLRPLTGHPPESLLAMEWLIALAVGSLDERQLPRGLSITLLRSLQKDTLPVTRAILFSKAAEGLRAVSLGAAPRNRKERTSLDRIAQALVVEGAFLGSGPLAAALVYRMQGLLPDGMDLGPVDDQRRYTAAVKELLSVIPDRAAQAAFLRTLIHAGPAPSHIDRLRGLLDASYADVAAGAAGPDGAIAQARPSEWSLADVGSIGYPGKAPAAAAEPDWKREQERGLSTRLQAFAGVGESSADTTMMTQELSFGDGGKVLLLSFQGRTTVLNTGGQTLLIGRDRRCDLRMDNPSVSRLHASITLDEDGFGLIDQSRNGTLVKCGDANLVRVRQNRMPLEGHGFIVPGETPTSREGWEQASIKFSVMSFDQS